MLSFVNSASRNLEKASNALKAGDYSGSIRYLQKASSNLKK